MNSGKSIFAQLMDFIPAYEFRKCVERYNGSYKIITFSCRDQHLCMAFAQLTYFEGYPSLPRERRATQFRLYHPGIRGNVSRNTLAHANQTRDWRIYYTILQILSVTLFEKTPIFQALSNINYTNQVDHVSNQLNLFD